MRLLGWAALAMASTFVAAAGQKDSDCLDCHADITLSKTNAAGRQISLFVAVEKLKTSAHGTNTCVACHADLTDNHPDDNVAAKPVDCRRCHERQTESYGASVHGVALKQGRAESANCKDCHDSHEVLPPVSTASPLHVSNQPKTCGQCHDKEAQDLADSVHGKALTAGVREAPTCTDCHSEHRIDALTGEEASRRLSAEVCSRCHASERLSTKYNLPADRVRTFFDSYHGLASSYGSTLAANCASCHGYHKILPSSDPNSTIHRTHLVETCGKCHPGATDKFAFSKVHVDLENKQSASDLGSAINWWVRKLYLVLIFVVIGGMLIHNGLLFFKKVRAHLNSTGRPVLRMKTSQRWQHAVLALSFTVLAITGFALKFPESRVALLLGSNEPFRRWAHRIAGVVLLLVGIYHVIYVLRTKDGWQLLRDLLPAKKDLGDLTATVRFLFGLSPRKPRIGRFGYAEKMEYWAVVWGTIIMGVTGLIVWFKMDVTHWLPRWLVDVALTVHYYEAILACLAIVVWHFYHVIFDPDVYPLNMACWDGKVSKHWQQEEHPLEQPALIEGVAQEPTGDPVLAGQSNPEDSP